MSPSRFEAWARLFVTKFLGSHISTDRLILTEEGGATFTFKGASKKSSLEVVLKVHNPQFYWKVTTRADIGLADAYIDGDLSFADKDQGLLHLIMANMKRGWWTPSLFTAGIASAKFFLQHVLRQNTLTQARRNISHHYDLSNEVFSLFLGETMAYSCAIFKTEDEDLDTAQLRKISALIEKARIDKKHEILDIGCGWGTFAIEVVKQTGCKCTGLTLSVEQLKYAEMKVKEAGLQDHIRLLLCDYRELPKGYKYDIIVSCEMIEHVGHEYMEDFFSSCESALAEDGLLVLQSTSIADERYDEYRRSSDFIKEYIFPGGCLPSLSRITSAMGVASRLCVEHVENIGSHYYHTLRRWRKNFLENKSKILAMGFDEKFIRTWEYYFDYCAAGFKSYTLWNYQIVFSRPGNVGVLGNPYKGFPSAYRHDEQHSWEHRSAISITKPVVQDLKIVDKWTVLMNIIPYSGQMDFIDRDIAGGEEPTKAMDDLLAISLRCILPQNERPNIRQVFDDLCSISRQDWGRRPFRFLNCWLEHPLFFENLKLSWTKACAEHAGRFSLLRKLSYLASTIRKWNENSFGNQDERFYKATDWFTGPDGFTFNLYKAAWSLIGDELFHVVSEFFRVGKMPKGVDTSYVTLLPKNAHSTKFKDFRPISLIHGAYKIVGKLLSSRI
ncbi:PREDICTED: uncharacterized protein LOC105137508 [Populus euphratica]|uniref:Uncharacterized protein LOC105137508 n=1 Tax=Populus euphratica TaxID=75702 RepID=A0AAJ6Y4A3_POPEU|nr:PREDICTED: uncharacterized protein LOC105137508 [Populus euphratica]